MQDDTRDQVASDFGPFAVVPAALLSDMRVSDRAVRVWCAIARYANRKTGEAFPAQRTLAADLDTSVDTIQRSIALLIHFGWLSVRARLSTDGKKRKLGNLYTVIYGNGISAASDGNGNRKTGGPEAADEHGPEAAAGAALYKEELTNQRTDHLDRTAVASLSELPKTMSPWKRLGLTREEYNDGSASGPSRSIGNGNPRNERGDRPEQRAGR